MTAMAVLTALTDPATPPAACRRASGEAGAPGVADVRGTRDASGADAAPAGRRSPCPWQGR